MLCPGVAKRRRERTFCRHGTIFIECWRDRGTMRLLNVLAIIMILD